MIVDVDADTATAGVGPISDAIPSGAAAVTGVALGVVICAAESVLFRTVIGVPGPGTVPFINRLIAPNQAYVMVGGWVLAAAAGVLLASARSGVVGWSTRPAPTTIRPEVSAPDGAAIVAAISLVILAVPLSILAVSGGPGAIPSWRAGMAGATAAAIGAALGLAAPRVLGARIVVLAYAASFSAEVVLARIVNRLSTSAWVAGSGSPALRTARAMAFSSTWTVVAYAGAGAIGAVVATAAWPSPKALGTAALTPTAGVILGLLVAGLATPVTLHVSDHVVSRLAAGLGAATLTALTLQRVRPRT
jgi:hypothetical protein